MIVPNTSGFKSIKWMDGVVSSNLFHGNDTYAERNKDVDRDLKTFARLPSHPKRVRAWQPVPVTGLGQIGVSGLSQVQVCLRRKDDRVPDDDPYVGKGDWLDAEILGPPRRWEGIPSGGLPASTIGFDAGMCQPTEWPMEFALARRAVLLAGGGRGGQLRPLLPDCRCFRSFPADAPALRPVRA